MMTPKQVERIDELFRLLEGTESPDECHKIIETAFREGQEAHDAALRQQLEEAQKEVTNLQTSHIEAFPNLLMERTAAHQEMHQLRTELAASNKQLEAWNKWCGPMGSTGYMSAMQQLERQLEGARTALLREGIRTGEIERELVAVREERDIAVKELCFDDLPWTEAFKIKRDHGNGLLSKTDVGILVRIARNRHRKSVKFTKKYQEAMDCMAGMTAEAVKSSREIYEMRQQLADLQAKLELKNKIIAGCVADEGELETAMEALGMVCYDDYGALQHDTVLTTFVKDLQAKLAAMESSHLIKVNEYGDRIVAFQRQLAEAQARVRELEGKA